jgi:type VI secretion system protein ImpB
VAKEPSVAPQERINIVYKPAVSMDQEVELPLKMVVLGDFTGRPEQAPLEERPPIQVDKESFDKVLRDQQISLQLQVRDRLTPDAAASDTLPVELRIDSLKSFEPEQIARQVPQLQDLLEIRDALVALKGPLGNIKQFANRLKQVLGDEAARERLLRELGVSANAGS